MRILKNIVRVLLVLLLLLATVAALIYWQACQPPESYHPRRLSSDQSQTVAGEFINRKLLDEFGNQTGLNKPFDWTLTQQQANDALASMDAISYQLGGKRDAIGKAMDKQGLSGPIVRFLDDRLELLIYSKQYDKVLTVGVSFASLPDGRLTVHLDDVHVGRLKVPQWVVQFRAVDDAGVAGRRHARNGKPRRRGHGQLQGHGQAAADFLRRHRRPADPAGAQVAADSQEGENRVGRSLRPSPRPRWEAGGIRRRNDPPYSAGRHAGLRRRLTAAGGSRHHPPAALAQTGRVPPLRSTRRAKTAS